VKALVAKLYGAPKHLITRARAIMHP
jgi:hypothetical protein